MTKRPNQFLFLPLALLLVSPTCAQDDGHGHNQIASQVQSRVYSPQIENLSTPQLVDAIATTPWPGPMVQAAADRGMASVERAAELLDVHRPLSLEALCEVIALAAKERRSEPELLRLYDPPAYRVFYTDEGKATQEKIGRLVSLESWPHYLPDALVLAAPEPTLTWMRAQAAAAAPDAKHLPLVWKQWGWWVRVRHERRYRAAIHECIAALTASAALTSDPDTQAALVQFIGDTQAPEVDYLAKAFASPDAEVRAAAAVALGRLGASNSEPPPDGEAVASRALAVLTDHAAKETDPVVLAKIAVALEGWPSDPAAGAAALALFDRANDPIVRRELMRTAAKVTWPQRSRLLLRAFDAPDGGVLGVSLQSIAANPPAESREPTLALTGQYKNSEVFLIDALGAIAGARATPTLAKWLETEKNPAVRVKLVLALEQIAGRGKDPEAAKLLVGVVEREADTMVMGQALGSVGRLALKDAAPALIELAKDTTAPATMRVDALWAMSTIDTPEVRAALSEMSRPQFGGSLPVSAAEQLRMFVAMARYRLNEPGAIDDVHAAFTDGSATTRLTILLLLAQMQRDDAMIGQGLASPDFAELLAAVKAAGASRELARKYHGQLVAIRDAPFIHAMMISGLDIWNFKLAMDAAVAEGVK